MKTNPLIGSNKTSRKSRITLRLELLLRVGYDSGS